MVIAIDLVARIQFLFRVVERELKHLIETDSRLFVEGSLSTGLLKQLLENQNLSEQVEAFVSRFGRLQDTLGDKLIPAMLKGMGEKAGAVIENLERAEQFEWIQSVEQWMTLRELRNQMVHEYLEDESILILALNQGHQCVPSLQFTMEKLSQVAKSRGFL